jgi:hypothetical protein
MEPTIEDRSILVIDSLGDVAAALRRHVPPSRAYVLRFPYEEAEEAAARLLPFPFAVVGVTRDAPPAVPPGLLGLMARHPIPVVWQGQPPADLPAHALLVDEVMECRKRVDALVDTEVADVILADFDGIEWQGREVHGCRALEGMLSLPQGPWTLPATVLGDVQQTIDAEGLPLRLDRDSCGAVRLVAPASVTRI